MRAPLPYFASTAYPFRSLPNTNNIMTKLNNKPEIGEYYLVTNNDYDTKLIKILSIKPGGHYYVEMDGVRKWLKDIGSFYDNLNYYIIEHLEKEYVTKLFREQKLERILKEE